MPSANDNETPDKCLTFHRHVALVDDNIITQRQPYLALPNAKHLKKWRVFDENAARHLREVLRAAEHLNAGERVILFSKKLYEFARSEFGAHKQRVVGPTRRRRRDHVEDMLARARRERAELKKEWVRQKSMPRAERNQ